MTTTKMMTTNVSEQPAPPQNLNPEEVAKEYEQ